MCVWGGGGATGGLVDVAHGEGHLAVADGRHLDPPEGEAVSTDYINRDYINRDHIGSWLSLMDDTLTHLRERSYQQGSYQEGLYQEGIYQERLYPYILAVGCS